MRDLLIIIPSRGRPESVPPLIDAFRETCQGDTSLLFALDHDPHEIDAYLGPLLAKRAELKNVGFTSADKLARGMVPALNHAALRMADNYRNLAFLGDDHRPRTKGWDARMIECLSAGAGIAYGNDLLQGERMPTAVFMTSSIVRTLGYMAPPEFGHLNIDLVWLEWGKAMGRITYLPDVIIEHMHPHNGKAKFDVGYERVNSQEQNAKDGAAYQAYMAGRFHDDVAKLKTLL